MKRLKIKQWRYLLSLTISIVLFQGCEEGATQEPVYGFIESVQVVEVDANTKSFRIVVEEVISGLQVMPKVYLDKGNTTARHNEHFVNEVGTGDSNNIGDFTSMDSNQKYREVKLIPENITSEVSIHYYILDYVNIDLNDRLEVILKPKTN